MVKKLFFVFAAGLILASCGTKQATGKEQTLNILLNEEGKTLDPQLATTNSSGAVLSFLMEGLTKVEVKTKEIIPGLAEKWEVSEDGLNWTFHLRDGLKWANGEALTAEDFRTGWLRALDPKVAAEYAYMLFPIKNARRFNSGDVSAEEVGIKAEDEKTLTVNLEHPVAYFTSLTAFYTYFPANKVFLDKCGEEFSLDPDKILSSGPFMMKEWTHGSNMSLVKNDNYYNAGNIKLSRVNIKYIKDDASSLNAFNNDELHETAISTEQYAEYKDDPRLKQVLQSAVWYIQYNTEHPVLKNADIRRAILLAVDKEEMCEKVFSGIPKPLYTMTPRDVGISGLRTNDFAREIGDKLPKFNVDEAKKALAKGLAELGLSKLPELSIIVNDSGGNTKAVQAIQEYLRVNLGITLNIEIMTFKERISRMQAGTFDMVYAGWSADYQDPMTYLDLFVTGGGNNQGKYSSREYDECIRKAQVSNDAGERFKAFEKAEEILARDIPVGVLFQSVKNYLVHPDLKNYTFLAIGQDMYFAESYFEQGK